MATLTERYCSVAGSGAHDGSSAANAWTMAEATANVVAGDRVNCLAGTYIAEDSGQNCVMDIDVAGTILNQIEWRGYTTTIGDFVPGTAPPAIIDAGVNALLHPIRGNSISGTIYNRFVGLDLINGSTVGAEFTTVGDNIGFTGCRFKDNGTWGVRADNNLSFLLCEFTGNGTGSIDADNDCSVVACKLHGEGTGPVINLASDANIINSLFYNNGGIVNVIGFSNFSVYGNTFDGDNVAGAIAVQISGSVNVFNTLVNNLFYDLDTAINFATSTAEAFLTRGYNYFSSCNTNYDNLPDALTDVDDGTLDPFTDSAARDYTLASGSNAIGAGVDAGNFV
tara:strand:- start:122 stop:1135 length:1014 start_codon:yes stop_codon:yes gene_type:complete